MAEDTKVVQRMAEATLLLENIERLLKNTKNRGVSEFTEPYLKNMLRTLNEYWDKANQINAEITFATPTAKRHEYEYFSMNVFELIEERFDNAETYITNYIDKLHTSIYEQPNASSSPIRQGVVESTPQTMNLPKLDLPKFSGDYIEWPTFADSYRAAIHDNFQLSPVQKFQYLKSSLKGTALDSISSLSLTNDNYEVAWNTLKAHYENNRMVITVLLNRFFSLRNVSSTRLQDLEQLRCDVFSTLDALKNAGVNTENWDPLIVHLVIQNFDMSLRRKWEESLARDTTYPKLERLKTFLESRIRPLEAMSLNMERQKTARPQGQRFSSHATSTDRQKPNSACPVCKASHNIYLCPEFQKLSPYQRQQKVREMKHCYNCLSHGHSVQQCRNPGRCRTCGQTHHSLLHFEKSTTHLTLTDNGEQFQEETTNHETHVEALEDNLYSHLSRTKSNHVLLATARIRVSSEDGRSLECRALIDPGSQGSFISETVAQFLRLPRKIANIVVSGVGSVESDTVRHRTTVNLSHVDNEEIMITIQAFILQRITNYRPQKLANLPVEFCKGLDLADPKFDCSDRIDVLIGADAYGLLLLDGIRKCPNSSLIAQNSKLGWIISGSMHDPSSSRVHMHHFAMDDLDLRLRSFWELEAVPSPQYESQEHARCEQLFRETTLRDDTGRFIVRLPFKSEEEKSKLGNSYKRAAFLLFKLQSRLRANEKLKQHYVEFMKEYQDLGHMSPIKDATYQSSEFVYLPHHGVIREDKLTTKLRVVLNGSAPTSTGVSLNDVLCAGPKLHNEIPGILLRWRVPRIVMCADIEKMFRQILVNEMDRHYQCILWQSADGKSVQPYEMNTVTYGTAPAPFLANRVIRQIATLCEKEAPLASQVLKRNIYVDDVLFGSDDQLNVQRTKSQVSRTLSDAGFILKKWISNKPESLTNSEKTEWEQLNGKNETTKVLGVVWNPNTDQFMLHTTSLDAQAQTKRAIASSVATCFDPLGWLAPLIIRAKCFLQSLWLIKVNWDERVPDNVLNPWRELAMDFNESREIPLPRWIHFGPNCKKLSLIGFCDASYQAYGAVIYARTETHADDVITSLLVSKSRVAPLQTISIPRLELCGAVLLTELVTYILDNLDVPVGEIRCFTDSQIVLAWLNKQPFKWTVFVANRISQIQTSLPQATWHHVKSSENPADLVSRGTTTHELRDSKLWWSGPEWLSSAEYYLKTREIAHGDTEMEERKINSHLNTKENSRWELFDRCSSWPKLLRVCAYIRRFVANARKEEQGGPGLALKTHEIERARIFIFRSLQLEMFKEELRALHGNGKLDRSSRLVSLNPVLDEDGLIRVGGRLKNAIIPVNERHPILLKPDPVTDLIIRHSHARGLHSGLKLTLKLLRESIWLLGARSHVKRIIHECTICIRYRARLAYQMMSDLPPERCNPSRPFSHTGLDYAGPFDIRTSSGRGHTSRKGWIALFVCCATKAVHIEVVSDYTTKGFLAALDRMIARRGVPSVIFSDNGTTFQGAESEIRKLLKNMSQNADVINHYTVKGLSWKGWQHDYLSSLQTRGKWKQASSNVRVGDLVLLRVPVSPPGYWPVARVLKVHPGSDDRVRVVTLRTSKTTLTRPIHQLCPLHSPSEQIPL